MTTLLTNTTSEEIRTASSSKNLLSRRLARRLLYHHKNKGTPNIVYKSISRLLLASRPVLTSSISNTITSNSVVSEPLILEKPGHWPTPEKKQGLIYNQYFFDECWNRFQRGLVPRMVLSSGAVIAQLTPRDFLATLQAQYWKKPEILISGWIPYAEARGLLGGVRPNKKRTTKKKRKPNVEKMDCSPGNIYETTATLTTTATGSIDLVIALNNPTQIVPGVTAVGSQDLANNWDAYSINLVEMHTQINAPIIARQGSWNLFVDHDSSPPVTTVSQALCNTYTDKRWYSSSATPRWSVRPRKLSQAEYLSGIGADVEPAVIVHTGKYDWNTPPSNGFMYVKLSNGPVSTTIGTLYVRVHVTAWFKRRLALTGSKLKDETPIFVPDKEDVSVLEIDGKVKDPLKPQPIGAGQIVKPKVLFFAPIRKLR